MARIGVVAVVAVGLLLALMASQRRHEPLKVSGFIEAHEIRLGSRVGGRVKKVHVAEGTKVKAGQPLLEFEPYQLLEQKAEAAAQLASARADFERLQAGPRPEEIRQAQARYDQLKAALDLLTARARPEDLAMARSQVTLSSAEVELAEVNRQRTAELQGKGKTAQDLDQADKELKVAVALRAVRQEELNKLLNGARVEEISRAEAQLEEARQAWELLKAGYRDEDQAVARAAVDRARASGQLIDRQMEELTISASANGQIEAIDLEPGDLVAANGPALSLISNESLWVRAYVPENHLNLALGQKLRLSVDSFPGETFVGHITFISRQAEFTPGNVQTPEDRSKQVFRIRVEIETGLDRLRAGMVADILLEK